jgi:hypothetical protein
MEGRGDAGLPLSASPVAAPVNKTASHASEGMTKTYQRDHEEVIWSEAIPDLNISEITG